MPESTPAIDVFTVGHSNYPVGEFVDLLKQSSIDAVADVRSVPFSRRSPQFNRRSLEASLNNRGIEYRFFGKALGGRPNDPKLYVGGTANYEAMAQTEDFKNGIERVLRGAKKHRLALMCSEQDPIECHRCLLIGRALSIYHAQVQHILPDGTCQSQRDVESRLLGLNRQVNHDFFVPPDEQLERAYRDQGMRVAFTERSAWSESNWETSDVEYR